MSHVVLNHIHCIRKEIRSTSLIAIILEETSDVMSKSYFYSIANAECMNGLLDLLISVQTEPLMVCSDMMRGDFFIFKINRLGRFMIGLVL